MLHAKLIGTPFSAYIDWPNSAKTLLQSGPYFRRIVDKKLGCTLFWPKLVAFLPAFSTQKPEGRQKPDVRAASPPEDAAGHHYPMQLAQNSEERCYIRNRLLVGFINNVVSKHDDDVRC
jgi:hypothetical protein